MSIDVDFNEKFIKLVEVADTWQGEGPDSGKQMLIARFKHCNRKCAFCDTWIKMKTSTEGSYSIDDINKALIKTRGLMITGGEPTLQNDTIKNFDQSIAMLKYCDYQIANVETNGYDIFNFLQKIHDFKDCIKHIKVIYSPKTFTEIDVLNEIEKMKLVIDDPLVHVKIVADTTPFTEKFIRGVSELTQNKSKIYLMPLGITPEEIMKNWPYCINLADELNLNLSTRMHIMNQFV